MKCKSILWQRKRCRRMFEFDSRIRYSEVDGNRNLTVSALLDYFQDATVFQSESFGLGVDHLMKEQIAWVLSSWQIIINRMPKLYEKVWVQTWPHGFKNFFGYRNFAIRNEQGELLAYANSSWIFMNLATGRPSKIPEYMLEAYALEDPLPMEDGIRKMAVPDTYEEEATVIVPKYFIDTNGHMNNGKYVLTAMEYVPENFKIEEIRAEYKKSAMCGDVIFPRVTKEEHKITINLAAEDGKTYAVVEFLERGAVCD